MESTRMEDRLPTYLMNQKGQEHSTLNSLERSEGQDEPSLGDWALFLSLNRYASKPCQVDVQGARHQEPRTQAHGAGVGRL